MVEVGMRQGRPEALVLVAFLGSIKTAAGLGSGAGRYLMLYLHDMMTSRGGRDELSRCQ
jgi:hypothetical protein